MQNYPFTFHIRLNAGCKMGCQQIPIFLFFYFPHFPTTQTQHKLIFMSLLDELLDLATTELLLCFSQFRCLKAATTVEARDDGGRVRKTVTTMVAWIFFISGFSFHLSWSSMVVFARHRLWLWVGGFACRELLGGWVALDIGLVVVWVLVWLVDVWGNGSLGGGFGWHRTILGY